MLFSRNFVCMAPMYMTESKPDLCAHIGFMLPAVLADSQDEALRS
jgi:hypothetical protein